MNGKLKASIFYFWLDQEEECAGDEDVKGPIFTLSRTPSTFFVPPAFFRGHSSSRNVSAFFSLKFKLFFKRKLKCKEIEVIGPLRGSAGHTINSETVLQSGRTSRWWHLIWKQSSLFFSFEKKKIFEMALVCGLQSEWREGSAERNYTVTDGLFRLLFFWLQCLCEKKCKMHHDSIKSEGLNIFHGAASYRPPWAGRAGGGDGGQKL